MGTRSTVKFYENFGEKDELILSVYHQYGGYIDGIGYKLANFIKNAKMINGICDQTMEEGYANGIGCLAAQYVKKFKTRIGGLYLTDANDKQEYNYEVRFIDGNFQIKVDDLFVGTFDELLAFQE